MTYFIIMFLPGIIEGHHSYMSLSVKVMRAVTTSKTKKKNNAPMIWIRGSFPPSMVAIVT